MEHISITPPEICLLCDNKAFTKSVELSDYFLTGEDFALYQCDACGLIHTRPFPAPSDLHRYYASEKYISHSGEKKSLLGKVYLSVRKYTHSKKFKLINRFTKGNSILDIGCATGEFLKYCEDKGMTVSGIEPNPKARNFAVSQYRLAVSDEPEIGRMKTGSFDVITMWHVLEHVPDLNHRMKELNRLLKDNGTAFIALPNHLSFDARHYGKHWAAWDVPRHLFHFNRKSFTRLAEKHGFEIAGVLPMKFDAYYVSLLSEKYRNGKSSVLNALRIGFISNLQALLTRKEYSSLIFIIKKSGNISL